jgi:hypothetical protein
VCTGVGVSYFGTQPKQPHQQSQMLENQANTDFPSNTYNTSCCSSSQQHLESRESMLTCSAAAKASLFPMPSSKLPASGQQLLQFSSPQPTNQPTNQPNHHRCTET